METKDYFKRGELAKLAGIGSSALRFYEREGVIDPPPRLSSGYRAYPKETLELVLFIKRSQELGFTLKEIKELIGLKVDKKTSCADICDFTDLKVEDIDKKIRSLKELKKALKNLSDTCRQKRNKTKDECLILGHLSGKFHNGG